MTVNTRQVIEEATAQNYSYEPLQRAIAAMIQRGDLIEKNKGNLLLRVK